MTKTDLRTLIDARLLLLAQTFTARAKYFVLDLKTYICYHRVLQMVKYISDSNVTITQEDLEMLEALTYQYSDINKVLIKRF